MASQSLHFTPGASGYWIGERVETSRKRNKDRMGIQLRESERKGTKGESKLEKASEKGMGVGSVAQLSLS